jgi:hypothetical protein
MLYPTRRLVFELQSQGSLGCIAALIRGEKHHHLSFGHLDEVAAASRYAK